jgi:hypothetical protein
MDRACAMSLLIRANWLIGPGGPPGGAELAFDQATLAGIKISAKRKVFTRLRDDAGRQRDVVRVSAYRLALWLTRNWWRLGHEAERTGHWNDPAWLDGHSLASIGEGWLWPRLTIAADGKSLVFRSLPEEGSKVEPAAWLTGAEVRVAREVFSACTEQFVRDVLDRLNAWKLKETELRTCWHELQAERSDPEVALYRQLEGSLGFDADEAPPAIIQRFHKDRDLVGVTAMTEVAANQAAGQSPLTAQGLRDAALHSGFASALGNGAIPSDLADDYGVAREPAWRYGERAAKRVRRKLGQASGLLTNHRLAELCSTASDGLTDDTSFAPMAFSLYETRRKGRVVFRSRWETGRRFELARLLGDQLLFPAEEALHPSTGAETFRQRAQRAFAAEFLCPYNDLREFLNGDISETAREEAGRHFLVSPRAVTTILVNKGHLARGSLRLLQ